MFRKQKLYRLYQLKLFEKLYYANNKAFTNNVARVYNYQYEF